MPKRTVSDCSSSCFSSSRAGSWFGVLFQVVDGGIQLLLFQQFLYVVVGIAAALALSAHSSSSPRV